MLANILQFSYTHSIELHQTTLNYTNIHKSLVSKDLKIQLYKRKRKKELSKFDYEFLNWAGKIDDIDSVGDEYAYVSISVCKNVTIKTWNNEFSDMMDKSLIHIDTELYEILLDFIKKEGGIIATMDKNLKIQIKESGGSVLSMHNDKIVLEN